MLQFPPGALIGAGQVILVAASAATFHTAYGFNPQFEITDSDPAVPNLSDYPDWPGSYFNLHNSGDEVLLLDGADLVVDLIAYGTSIYPDFQPTIPGVAQGHSIARSPGWVDTDTAADWIDLAPPSPGQIN